MEESPCGGMGGVPAGTPEASVPGRSGQRWWRGDEVRERGPLTKRGFYTESGGKPFGGVKRRCNMTGGYFKRLTLAVLLRLSCVGWGTRAETRGPGRRPWQ